MNDDSAELPLLLGRKPVKLIKKLGGGCTRMKRVEILSFWSKRDARFG